MADRHFIDVDKLTMNFGNTVAVDGISFSVGQKEHVTLLGPSGCGKTTTLRAVAGLETPRAGRISIDGKPVFDTSAGINVSPEHRGLAMVFQSYAIWPHMTVYDNVAFSFRVRGISREKTRPAVERALALVDLAGYAERPATKLSGGQQQRVALARAIAFDCKVILFDEPLSNLDAQLRITMRSELATLRDRLGFTAIYVTHDQEEAFALSDRIVIMRAGRIEQQGTPAEIHAAPRTRFIAAFLGMKNIFDANVAAASTGFADTRLSDGTVLRAAVPTSHQGDAATLSFRPINVRLHETSAPGQGGTGIVTRALFLGDLVHYTVKSGDLEITAYDRPRPELAEGRSVHWRVEPEHCLLIGD